jgi:hypothetical protein
MRHYRVRIETLDILTRYKPDTGYNQTEKEVDGKELVPGLLLKCGRTYLWLVLLLFTPVHNLTMRVKFFW